MLGHDCTGSLLGYAGLGPGQELMPYFFALLAWAAAALLAVLQRPLAALLRIFAGPKGQSTSAGKQAPAVDPAPAVR